LSLQAFAPAKINLFLHVGAPGADGYHPLCSLMVFADVGDRLAAQPAAELALDVRGAFAREVPGGPDNLVLRAAQALLAEGAGQGAARLTLEKALPVAAGLGGGSSDAGAALRLLRDLLRMDVSDDRLEAAAAALGADGAACLWSRPTLAEGRGERLSPAPGLPELHAVLANPVLPVSTPAVYRRLDELRGFGDVSPPPMPEAFEDAAELAAWLVRQRNDLQAPAVAVEPAVGAVLETLADEPETLLARVSGSGGTCFALCASEIEADGLAERVERLAPHWWVRRCRLGGPWPDAL
jgi:4-diphosphocytidyl-2-C-methyl-D-erythritol kinase